MKNSQVRIKTKSLQFQYKDRKRKKRYFSSLFTQRINSILVEKNFSQFIHLLKTNNIKLNKKILSNLVITESNSFNHILNVITTNK
jgi:large subunit ribosomal protein L20